MRKQIELQKDYFELRKCKLKMVELRFMGCYN